MDLKQSAFIIFKNKYKIMVFLLSSLLIVLLALRMKPPTYNATAQILVKLGREISVPSQDVLEGQGYILPKRQEDIYAEVEILESVYLIEEVIRKIGHDKILSSSQPTEREFHSQFLSFFKDAASSIHKVVKNILTSGDEQELTPYERAVIYVQKRLKVKPLLRSETIKISYSDHDPDMADNLLKTFLNKYFERHIKVHKGDMMQDLFQRQSESYGNKLANIEEKLAVLKKEKNIFSLDMQRSELIQQVADIREKLDQTQRDILNKTSKINRIKDQLVSQSQIFELPGLEDQNPIIHTLKDKLVDLELKKQQLLLNYSPESRTMANVNSEITMVKEQLVQEQSRIMFTNQKDLNILKLKEDTLNKEIKRYLSELEKINNVEVEKNLLELEKKILEQNYLLYTKELEEARISEVMDLAKITNVRVIQPVSVSKQPEGSEHVLILMLTASICLLISVSIVFLFEHLDHSLGTARDVEHFLKLPVIGSIREKK